MTPPLRVRDASEADLPALQALNAAAVPHVNDVPVTQLAWFLKHAASVRLAEEARRTVGFLVALDPETDYASPNFRWFQARYPRFRYVDRVVVAEAARGRGVGRALYEDLVRRAPAGATLIACEVNLRPPNPGSLRFHRGLGFREVGRQSTDGGAKEVALLVRELPAGHTADK